MKKRVPDSQIKPDFNWSDIDTVLLDMDGTLLDKYFDDYFWEKYVPISYAEKNGITIQTAEKKLLQHYGSVESTLVWSDLLYWSRRLKLDIFELKCRIDHLINIHPYVIDFLNFINNLKKNVYLVTAAHPLSLDLKLQKTSIGSMFDRIICTDEIGSPKEDPLFWKRLEKTINYNPARTVLADDTAKVLRSADSCGIRQLIFVARPSSKKPVIFSDEFPSIVYFNELIF